MGNDLMRQYVGLAGRPRYHDGLEQTKGRGTCGRPRQITQVSMPSNPTNMKHHLKSGSAKIFCHEVKELTSIIISLDPARGFCTDHMKWCTWTLEMVAREWIASGSRRVRCLRSARSKSCQNHNTGCSPYHYYNTITNTNYRELKYSNILSESQHWVQVRTKTQ